MSIQLHAGIPQIIVIFYFIYILSHGAKHDGKEYTTVENFGWRLIDVILYVTILYCGGFFK